MVGNGISSIKFSITNSKNYWRISPTVTSLLFHWNNALIYYKGNPRKKNKNKMCIKFDTPAKVPDVMIPVLTTFLVSFTIDVLFKEV